MESRWWGRGSFAMSSYITLNQNCFLLTVICRNAQNLLYRVSLFLKEAPKRMYLP